MLLTVALFFDGYERGGKRQSAEIPCRPYFRTVERGRGVCPTEISRPKLSSGGSRWAADFAMQRLCHRLRSAQQARLGVFDASRITKDGGLFVTCSRIANSTFFFSLVRLVISLPVAALTSNHPNLELLLLVCFFVLHTSFHSSACSLLPSSSLYSFFILLCPHCRALQIFPPTCLHSFSDLVETVSGQDNWLSHPFQEDPLKS
jgi:hypothetical protein